jgi:hypothetical protein
MWDWNTIEKYNQFQVFPVKEFDVLREKSMKKRHLQHFLILKCGFIATADK